jgi:hypothetical protein
LIKLLLKRILRTIRSHFFLLSSIYKAVIVQSRYKRLIIQKKRKILNKKLKVAFFVSQKQLWFHEKIYENFLLNSKFEPLVVVFPNNENKFELKKKTLKDNYNFFIKKNFKVILGYKEYLKRYISLNELNADIIFYDQPVPGLPKKLLFYQASKSALICYVPYGFKIANFKQAHFNMELQNLSWKVFAESNWHKKQFIKHSIIKGRNVVTSGYPKLDNYSEIQKKSSKIKYKKYFKIIIWAPHWSVKHPISFSTFDKNYVFFKTLTKKYSNIYWVFKPHQRLRYHLEEINFLPKEKIDEYYSFWKNIPNGEFYNESDYFDIFKNSDALITDCGSFLAEYLPTGCPILNLVNKHSQGFNEIGKKLVKSYYKAFNNEGIIKFIEDVIINNNDYLKEKRLKNLSIVRPNNYGASKFIVEKIIKELNINNDEHYS